MSRLVALLDCANFFASCERVFRPDLAQHPIVVLSNNDGCAIAYCPKAAKLGVRRGDPFFKFKSRLAGHNVQVFSSNFKLYGDLSKRVMQILLSSGVECEVYSIDEAFLHIDTTLISDVDGYLRNIKQMVESWVGIPIRLGLGPTKTLAKLANRLAKNHPHVPYVSLCDPSYRTQQLARCPVQSIWGISTRLSMRLSRLDIHFAQQLAQADPAWIRRHFGLPGERLVHELRGIYQATTSPESGKKSIISSRSFSATLTQLSDLEIAVSEYVAMACLKLRRHNRLAQYAMVFTKARDVQRHHSLTQPFTLPYPTADTPIVIEQAKAALSLIYRPGVGYKKAGIMLYGLIEDTGAQQSLFEPMLPEKLMPTVDQLNRRFGSKSVYFAAQHGHQGQGKSEYRSPEYTTKWSELMLV